MSVLSRASWTVTPSSTYSAGYEGAKAIDGDLGTIWHSASGYPHDLDIDLGSAQTFDFLRYIPRSTAGTQPKDVELYVSDDGATWGSAIASATWPAQDPTNPQKERVLTFSSQTKRYVRLHMLNGIAGTDYASCAEIYLGVAELSDRVGWTAYATNELSADYAASKMLDGDTATFWASSGGYPLEIWVDMGKAYYLDTLKYNPRQDGFQDRFGAVEAFLSDNGTDWGSAVASATWANSLSEKSITFTGATKRWFKLACSAVASGGRDYGSCSEIYAEGTAPVGGGSRQPIMRAIC